MSNRGPRDLELWSPVGLRSSVALSWISLSRSGVRLSGLTQFFLRERKRESSAYIRESEISQLFPLT
uniref:Alcohol dehydrogenase n=1 Tax=Rhizophora mucronata TaxID=61149 RepID=A0A2P2MKB2_RHIMU